ncbi:MAG TPA: sensor histidine kinase [Gaiellaceae bacterium]|nr:sensor histidine kinase [Gaiellaceae bacterium]
MTQVEAFVGQVPSRRRLASVVRLKSTRKVAGIFAIAAAYYATAKLGQALSYTGSVAALWPPAGVGIAVLYLWGLGWWPGVFLGDLLVNLELLDSLPHGSLIGQQVGNMAEIVIGAALLRRLIGRRAELDRIEQVTGTFVALAIATAISATVGTVSMLAGGVIDRGELSTFWRTWWLGDLCGGLVLLPLIVVWARSPESSWRRVARWEVVFLLAGMAAVAWLAVSTNATVTYLVFPALIYAAFRFGMPGATLAILIVAGTTIGVTAHNVGAFSHQRIDSQTLSTQLYISVAAVTTLLLSAVVSERERSTAALAEAERREGERAVEERTRIARELHDSMSQALFSTILQTRAAQSALRDHDVGPAGRLASALAAIGELTRVAQNELRGLIFELGRDPVGDGLVAGLTTYAKKLQRETGLEIEVEGPAEPLPLSHAAATEVFGISREALSNVVKHSGAVGALVHVADNGHDVVVEIRDDGRGFDTSVRRSGHYGLESMQGRADEIGAELIIASVPGGGTVVRVDVAAGEELA